MEDKPHAPPKEELNMSAFSAFQENEEDEVKAAIPED